MPLSWRAGAGAALALAVGIAAACGGRTDADGSGGTAGAGGAGGSGGSSAQGGVGALGGSTCVTAEGVRLCGGEQGECGWMSNDDCPGGGVFHHAGSDAAVARLHGRCSGVETCLARAQLLPGGFDCYDSEGKLLSE